MKCQIPLEVSFHRKASSSCEGGFSNSGLQRSEISSGRIKISTPQPVLHLLPSQWLPLALYLTACVRYIFKPFFFLLWIRYRVCCCEDSLFPVVREEMIREARASAKNADSEFINLRFCKSKCNWTRLQKCISLLI